MAGTPKFIKKFIERLNEEELHALYFATAQRLNLVHRAKAIMAMKDFEIFDRVYFMHEGRKIEGMINRLNQRTITVITDDRIMWKVSPNLLTKIEGEPNPLKEFIMSSQNK